MKYKITIKGMVTKDYIVEGDDEDDAVIEAHEKFTVLNDDTPEDYEQETVRVEAITE
jgi:hypothetical protein